MAESRMLKGDDGSALRFFWGTDKNENRSIEFGRPVFDKVLYLEVISPGQSASSPVHWLRREFDPETKLAPQENSEIIARYPAAYKAFLDGEESRELTGTPIEQWPAIDVAMAETLRASRIYTVEALAALPDEKLRLIGMGGRDLRARAQAYLDAAAGNADNEGQAARMSQLAEELERVKTQLAEVRAPAELEKENAALRQQVQELTDRLAAPGPNEEDLIGNTPPDPVTEPAAPAKAKTQTKV